MSTTIKSFFERQKRDLSDKSNEDDERKKVREREREKPRLKALGTWRKLMNP